MKQFCHLETLAFAVFPCWVSNITEGNNDDPSSAMNSELKTCKKL